jgi:hypothetical protein
MEESAKFYEDAWQIGFNRGVEHAKDDLNRWMNYAAELGKKSLPIATIKALIDTIETEKK